MKIQGFHGRMTRGDYFAATVLLYAFGFAFGALFVVGAANTDIKLPLDDVPRLLRGIKMPEVFGWTCFGVGLVGLVYVVFGSLGTSVRRLHDFGLTGFLVLLYPALKHVVPDMNWPDALPGPADLLWDLIMIAQPGTRGPNAFGDDPRDEPPEAAAQGAGEAG